MSFIAGQYTVTLGSSTVGQLQAGITLEHTVFKEPITGDNHAKARQDAVYQGEDMTVSYVLLEYNALAARAAFWPYGTTYLTGGIRGRLDSGLVAQLVATAIAGTPAAATPASFTLPRCILSAGFPTKILFIPGLRTIPVQQDIYPDASYIYGTLT